MVIWPWADSITDVPKPPGFADGPSIEEVWIDGGSSVDSAIAFDLAGGLDAPVGVVPATDAAESVDLFSPPATDGAGGADGIRESKASSSGCSCAVGGRRDLAPGAVLLLLVLARRRIARPPVGRTK
jgi:hypothetical protein